MGRLASAALLLLACLSAAQAADKSPAAASPPDDRALVKLLQAGGSILYIRHAATDFSKNDAAMTSYEDCASQRPLTDEGRATARRIGEAIRKLRIPVARVLASPYCRTVETANLVFGKAEKSNEVRGGPASAEDPARYGPLRKLLASPPPKGTNSAISSHGNPFFAVAGPPYLSEGEIAVIRPAGSNGFEVLARLRPDDWERLAR